jgi:hypothetical protein
MRVSVCFEWRRRLTTPRIVVLIRVTSSFDDATYAHDTRHLTHTKTHI